MVSGSCLCGRFAFEVDGPFQFMAHCHCTYCRKAHGSTFATYVGAPTEGFRWISGEGEQASYASSKGLERAFCPTCGSKVPSAASGDALFFPAGLLDGDPGVRPAAQIFTASKAPWHDLDEVPAFEAAPPGSPDPGLPTPPRPRGAAPDAIAGSCLCGAVAWEATKLLERMGHCHCSRCRKVRGAAFSTQVFAAHEDFRWIHGRDQIQEFQLPGAVFFGNSFCRTCASPVPRGDNPRAPFVLIPAGPLDDDPGVRPMAHIYVGSKAAWFEIRDSLPQFDEMPPG